MPSNFVNLNQDYNRYKNLNYYCDYLKPQTLVSIDINKRRKNMLYYGEFDRYAFKFCKSQPRLQQTQNFKLLL